MPMLSRAWVEAEVQPEIRMSSLNDPEYVRQRRMYIEHFEKSEGYDVDWDYQNRSSLPRYEFAAVKFEWAGEFEDGISNKVFMESLIKTSIEAGNEEYGTNLEFVKYVSANVLGVQGFLFYITFWAKDVSSSDSEPKLYQAKVRTFMDDILVCDFRLRPTQEPFV